MRKRFVRRGLLPAVAGCLLVLGLASGWAQGTHPAPTDGKGSDSAGGTDAGYRRDRFLVKAAPKAAEYLFEAAAAETVLPVEKIPVAALRAASHRHGVFQWEILFPDLPPGEEETEGLRRIFLLHCGPETDIPAAVEEFNRLTEWVEYAEPDRSKHVLPYGGR